MPLATCRFRVDIAAEAWIPRHLSSAFVLRYRERWQIPTGSTTTRNCRTARFRRAPSVLSPSSSFDCAPTSYYPHPPLSSNDGGRGWESACSLLQRFLELLHRGQACNATLSEVDPAGQVARAGAWKQILAVDDDRWRSTERARCSLALGADEHGLNLGSWASDTIEGLSGAVDGLDPVRTLVDMENLNFHHIILPPCRHGSAGSTRSQPNR